MRLNPFRRRKSISEAYARMGAQWADGFVRGLTEEPTGTPEEQARRQAEMFAFSAGVAHRAFPALYADDE